MRNGVTLYSRLSLAVRIQRMIRYIQPCQNDTRILDNTGQQSMSELLAIDSFFGISFTLKTNKMWSSALLALGGGR